MAEQPFIDPRDEKPQFSPTSYTSRPQTSSPNFPVDGLDPAPGACRRFPDGQPGARRSRRLVLFRLCYFHVMLSAFSSRPVVVPLPPGAFGPSRTPRFCPRRPLLTLVFLDPEIAFWHIGYGIACFGHNFCLNLTHSAPTSVGTPPG